MADHPQDWAVQVDLEKLGVAQHEGEFITPGEFLDADGKRVRVTDDVVLVEPLLFAPDWPPAPAGTGAWVIDYIERNDVPEKHVHLELDCPGPGGATITFALPSQVRFLKNGPAA